jgi:hypothetical protein
MGTKCETRFRWTNENYLELTDEDHYSNSRKLQQQQLGAVPGTKTVVPSDTQKWLISGPSGCWKQLHDFNGPTYADGHRLGVDPACDPRYDAEFWAIASPLWSNTTRNDIDQPFAIVESHPNMTRRRSYYVNTTALYKGPDMIKNCTCVPDNDPLAALMVSQAHYHLYTPESPEDAYFHQRDECDGHVFHIHIFPPSPPPPNDDIALPPSPPYFQHEILATTGAFGVSGVFFLFCCTMCAWVGLGGRHRGAGRGKWWGTNEMRIDRPPLYADDEPCAKNGGRADISGFFSNNVAFASLPLLEKRV